MGTYTGFPDAFHAPGSAGLRPPGDGHPAHRGLSLGPGEGELPAGVLDVLLADRNRPVLDVQVISEEGN